jgi:hypothetical protein
MQIAILVPGLFVRFIVVEVAADHGWPTHTKFASDVVVCYIISFIIDKPMQIRVVLEQSATGTYLTSVLGMKRFPTLPVSSLSG